MIAEINSRMFRPQAGTIGVRQQVASRKSTGMSRRMARVVALIICVSLLVVFAFSQVMNWQIAASSSQLAQLETARNDSRTRNIELLASRAQLASQRYIEEKAKDKLKLLVPQRNQIRRL